MSLYNTWVSFSEMSNQNYFNIFMIYLFFVKLFTQRVPFVSFFQKKILLFSLMYVFLIQMRIIKKVIHFNRNKTVNLKNIYIYIYCTKYAIALMGKAVGITLFLHIVQP